MRAAASDNAKNDSGLARFLSIPGHNSHRQRAIQCSVPGCQPKPLPISSSTPPEFAPEQVKLFRAVLQHLNETSVPYVVSGAAALQLHTGICRDTKDLDLFLPAEHVEAALRSLREEGFATEVADPVWLAKAHRGEFYVDLITGMSNAVVVVDQSWIDRGVPSDFFGVPVKVLAAEELIASKLFVTRRERFDGADIVHVVYATKGKLHWPRLMDLVGEHWEMLLWYWFFIVTSILRTATTFRRRFGMTCWDGSRNLCGDLAATLPSVAALLTRTCLRLTSRNGAWTTCSTITGRGVCPS